ncbi:hypothetical protein FFLO_00677 [Filobasidium floriforme]|uniref:Flavin reductase like domain-containing protein n=1 Tax=Filobasidium floriforme TaxID=5210 RepID=A0A8K0JSH3_9TREE|nr:flavin reductase like domain-containing protein [Filobasidium floriforme]KAG7571325.1 hypothetical protein FFLO_00677 [Filobasidium floriforme]KAH8086276.1 flavin reductase like domain-containing protein [Filobasidium floriforme]
MILRTTILPRLPAAGRWSRRSLHTVGDQLRNVMRSVPQPVAIVITRLEDGTHHGATLSSFTSISLSPPLVSFSLRLPSRLATALQSNGSDTISQSPEKALSRTRTGASSVSGQTNPGQTFTVSLLSKSNELLAHTFSQARSEHENMVRDTSLWEPFSDSSRESGLPVVKGGLGALECRVVGWLPLNELESSLGTLDGMKNGERAVSGPASRAPLLAKGNSSTVKDGGNEGSTGSMLFLAQVERVTQRKRDGEQEGELDMKPLVYENQRYVTTTTAK